MFIEYKEICIRNAEKKDCNQLSLWWNDGKIMAHAGFPMGINISPKEIEDKIANDDDRTVRRLVIEYKGKLIGEMNFRVHENNRYEIGIKICNEDYQEKGLGRICLSMLINELFNLGAKLIFLDTNLKNTRAQHVYELLGFKKISVDIDSWKNQVGELQSTVNYELVESDFNNYIC